MRTKFIESTELFFLEDDDQKTFKHNYESIAETIQKDRDYINGTMELLWELEREGKCKSYARNRIYFLAYKLDILGIRAIVKENFYTE